MIYFFAAGLNLLKLQTLGQLFSQLRTLRGNYVTNQNKETLLVKNSDLEGLRFSMLTAISKATVFSHITSRVHFI